MPYEHDVFFDEIKSSLFNNSFSQEQVDGINALLDYMEHIEWDTDEPYLRYWCSYVFATAYHETAYRMVPIEEYGSDSYLQGKPYYPWYGRGHVQLTWQENYQRAEDNIVSRELLTGGKYLMDGTLCQMGDTNYKEQALDDEVSSCVIYTGMWEGWFTGAKLNDYLTNDKKDYNNARRIVNGTDRASTIAGYAEKFEDAFDASWLDERPSEPTEPPPPDVPDKPTPPEVQPPIVPPEPGAPEPLWPDLPIGLDRWLKRNPLASKIFLDVPREHETSPRVKIEISNPYSED